MQAFFSLYQWLISTAGLRPVQLQIVIIRVYLHKEITWSLTEDSKISKKDSNTDDIIVQIQPIKIEWMQ